MFDLAGVLRKPVPFVGTILLFAPC